MHAPHRLVNIDRIIKQGRRCRLGRGINKTQLLVFVVATQQYFIYEKSGNGGRRIICDQTGSGIY
jgi:hypothetical protein